MTKIPVQSTDEGDYQTAPFAPQPNRYISALRRGTRFYFDAARPGVPNIASELTADDIETLRAAGHAIIEDPGEPLPGAVGEGELKRRYDAFRAIVDEAQAKGDLRTVALNDEPMRMAANLYNDFRARKTAPAPAAA